MKIEKKASFYVIMLLFVFLFFHRFFIQTFGIPEAAKYILDLLNVSLFIFVLLKKRIKNASYLTIYGFLYFIIILIGTLSFFMFGNIWNATFTNYLFDIRNLIRFPIFFIACYNLLNRTQIEKIFTFIIGFHLVNCVYVIYQYFTLEVTIFWMRGDNLNGFFGTDTGGNKFLNVLMIVTTIIVLDKFIKKEYSRKFTMFFSILNLVVAVLVELKIYFIEFIFIVIFFAAPYIKKPTKKQLKITICAIILAPFIFYGLIQLLYKLYPSMVGSMSISGMLAVTTSDDGYTGTGDLNRLNAIGGVINRIFKGDVTYSLIGVGLGTANLNGEFARIYENTHFSWMSTSYMFIETGFIGFISYTISLALPLFKLYKKNIYRNLSRVGALSSIILMVYDEALRTEAAYMIFFLISTGFVYKYDCMEEFNKCQKIIK